MSTEQAKAVISLFEKITHKLVEGGVLTHEDKVKLLDDLSAVKREFGIDNPVTEST